MLPHMKGGTMSSSGMWSGICIVGRDRNGPLSRAQSH